MSEITPSLSQEHAVAEVTRLVQDQPGVRGVKLSEITIIVTNTSLGVILPILKLLREKGVDHPLNFKSPILNHSPVKTAFNDERIPSVGVSDDNGDANKMGDTNAHSLQS